MEKEPQPELRECPSAAPLWPPTCAHPRAHPRAPHPTHRWGRPRPAGLVRALLPTTFLLTAVLLTAPLSGRDAQAGEASPGKGRSEQPQVNVGGSGKHPCPDCTATGKTPCGTCHGLGHLERDCTKCAGRGQRPCSVCTKKDSAAGPGRLPCNLCSGTGALRATGRACNRCGGEQTLTCRTCLGSGTRPCVAKIRTKICPQCQGARKVSCGTCAGKKKVTAAALSAARKRAQARRAKEIAAKTPRGRRSKASGSSKGRARSQNSKRGASPDEDAPLDPVELEKRIQQLRAIHDVHLGLFTVDPSYELESSRKAGKKLLQRLRAYKVSPEDTRTIEKIANLEGFVGRIKNFRKRWGELRTLFEKELRAFRTLKSSLESRDRILESLPAGRREREEERIHRRIDLALRVCEKASAPFVAQNPQWLEEELEDLKKRWERVELDSQAALTTLARAETEALAAAVQAKSEARTSAGATRQAARDRVPRARLSPASKRSRPPASLTNVRRREVSSDRPRNQPANPAGGRVAKSPATESSSESEGGIGAGLLWALCGFALAYGLFALRGRQQRDRSISDDPLPLE